MVGHRPVRSASTHADLPSRPPWACGNSDCRTRGLASVTDATTAVCVLPGTELAFAREVRYADWRFESLTRGAAQVKTPHKTAIFREINKGQPGIHCDALEFPDGNVVLLTRLYEGQEATVLQLPAETRVPVEAKKREPGLIVV